MVDSNLRPGSLVLYKIHPALVSGVSDKIDIQLEGGKTKRVRDKDVTMLHPGPVNGLASVRGIAGNVEEAWELLDGEQTTLRELAELVYGDYSPAAAWGAWELLADGLYFQGRPDSITPRSPKAVASERTLRDSREREQREWNEFIERVRAGQVEDSDRKRLAEAERVALGMAPGSRILAALGVNESADAAHAFLVRCGYWRHDENPWPRRVGVQLDPVEIGIPDLVDEARRDLTHLDAWAIDDVGNQDPDDAISIDGDRLWVHVSDVAALVRRDGHADLAARSRGANLYLPERIHTMLPEAITHRLGLGLAEESPALSFGFRFDGEQVTDIEVVPSRLRVQRISYDEANTRLHEPAFTGIRALTDAYRASRLARNAARIDLPEVAIRVVDGEVVIRPLARLASRDMVTDAMLMAGEAAARFAHANGIAIPYAMQPTPDEIRQPEGMAAMYAYRRLFKPSQTTLSPDTHFGLGLPIYARATSPLRRYADLVVHQQLRSAITGGDPLSADQLAERIAGLDSASALIRRAERLSNQHWKMVYLANNPGWTGAAVVVALEERKAAVMIPALALDTKIRLAEGMQLDQVLTLGVREVDIAAQTAYFGSRKG